jgi:hypothetical protein
MSNIKKIIKVLSSQVKSSGVKLPQIDDKTHTILQDNNQSIHDGVINEIVESNLRGKSQSKKRGRPKSKS